MIAPDDPRHGIFAGYRAGCREGCCRKANARRANLRRMGRLDHYVDGTGTRRRIRALRRIGWRSIDIAEAAGVTLDALGHMRAGRVGPGQLILSANAARFRRAYEQLAMTRGPLTKVLEPAASWPAPLDWDDETIDDPEAKPYRARLHRRRADDPPTTAAVERSDVDEVLVLRALRGERVVGANPAERLEVARCWTRDGGSIRQLNQIQGWNLERDQRDESTREQETEAA